MFLSGLIAVFCVGTIYTSEMAEWSQVQDKSVFNTDGIKVKAKRELKSRYSKRTYVYVAYRGGGYYRNYYSGGVYVYGGTGGGICGLCCLIFFIWFCCFRGRRSDDGSSSSSEEIVEEVVEVHEVHVDHGQKGDVQMQGMQQQQMMGGQPVMQG